MALIPRFCMRMLAGVILVVGTCDTANAYSPTRDVYFDYNSAALTPTAQTTLDHLTAEVSSTPAIISLVVDGTSDLPDPHGTNETADSYNAKLAHARAEAVRAYLAPRVHIPVAQGAVRTFDKASSDAQCETLASKAAIGACKAKGRRVEIELVR